MTLKAQNTLVHLWIPSMDRRVTVKRKIALDGEFVSPKHGINAPIKLYPQLSMNQGKEIHIDSEKNLQIKYHGLKGWIGPDPRAEYAEKVKRISRNLQTRGFEWEKMLWPAIILIGICFAAVIGMGLISVGN